METSGNKGRKREPPKLTITRHYTTMTPEETDEVVELAADLLVNFIKKNRPIPTKNDPKEKEEH